MQNFKNGDLDIIVNVDIFSEGFDCPDLEVRPIGTTDTPLVKYIQQVGHWSTQEWISSVSFRDNVGIIRTFGLPDDNRPWEQYFEGGPSSSIRQLK